MATTLNDYSILNVLEALDENEIQIKADGVFVDKDGASHNLTVFDNTYFRHNCLISFRSWKITLWDDPETAFPALFSSWWGSRKDLYLKQAYAYTLKYNPIENYASHEVMTDDETVTEYDSTLEHEFDSTLERTPADIQVDTTHPAKKTETTFPTERKTETTPYNTTETTTPNDDTTTHSTKGFNSTNFVEVDKDVRSGSVTVTTTHPTITKETVSETVTGKESVDETYTGTDRVSTSYQNHEVTDHDGKDTDTHSGKDTTTRNYTLDKTGNIGVQTAAEMLQREYDGLKQDLARRALTEFITRYCYLSEALDI